MIDRRLWHASLSQRWWMVLAVVFGALGGGVVILQAWLLSQVISKVFLEHYEISRVAQRLWLLALIIVLRAILNWAGEMCGSLAAIKTKASLRQQIYEHLYKSGPVWCASQQTGGLTALGTEGIEALDAYFAKYLPQVALSAVIPISMLVFIFPLDWVSGLVLLLTAPLIPFFMVLVGKMAGQETQKHWNMLSRLSAHFLDVIQGLETLKSLGRSREMADSIDENSRAYVQATLGVLRIAFLSSLTLELLSTLSTAIVAVEIGLRLLHGGIGFQFALFILVLAPEYYLPLRNLGLHFHAGMDGVAAADQIFKVLRKQPEISGMGKREIVFGNEIVFEDIDYIYQDRSEPAVKNVNLHIAAGEKVALIGHSGAGKSTLVNLLLGFIPPQRGRLTIDGVDLREIDLENWRAQIAWISQQPALFRGSLEENLRFARPDASHEDLVRAAKLAEIDTFIQSLPERYRTEIGEGGLRLSGGQAQRLALARAFLKDAPVLVFDEPASHLDPATEERIYRSLEKLMQGRTTLIIAHRLITLQLVDRILVMQDGEIVEQGTQAELGQSGEVYANLIHASRGAIP